MTFHEPICFLLCCIFFSMPISSSAKPMYASSGFHSWLERTDDELHEKLLSDGACEACKILTDVAQFSFSTDYVEKRITQLATVLCNKFKIEDNRVCNAVVKEFREEVLTVFDKAFLTPGEVCGSIFGPACAHKRNLSVFWNVTLPGTKKPPVKPIPPPKPGSPVSHVLHISDMHVDGLYMEGGDPNCGEPLCCRKNDPTPAPGKPKAGKYGDYKCDIPLITLESMLQHISTTHKDIDYVLWTGDVPPHNIWNQSRSDQVSAIDKAVKLLLKYFPGATIFPAVGNHEGAPVNSFPPPFITGTDSNQWLRNSLADHWKIWLPDYATQTIYKGGYYSVLLSKGFRLVSLNMNYCNNENWWLLIDSVDPAQQLEWLVSTLQEAEDNGEKVHIVGHIPPGSSDCLKPWSWNYYKIINRYQSTVTAQFFGHTHADEFEIFYDEKTRRIPTNIVFFGPSVTTFQTHNPGYRIYEIDGDYQNSSRVVLNHETWILDLVEANKGNVTWQLEYNAKDAYKMESLLPADWDNLVHRMAKDDHLFGLFIKYFWKSAPNHPWSERDREYYLCRLMSGRSYDSSACTIKQIDNDKERAAFESTLDFC